MSGVKLEIKRIVGGGAGLAHHEGDTWMVAGGLPGETVTAEPGRRRAGVVEARATAVLADPNPARLADPCPHAPGCGGCDWPHVDPILGADLKREAAGGAARTWPELAARLRAAPLRTSPPAYRLRARLHWDPAARALGFYGHRSWQVTAIPACRIVSPRLVAALPDLGDALARRCSLPVDLEWLEDLEGRTAVAAMCRAPSSPTEIAPAWVPTARELSTTVDGLHIAGPHGLQKVMWGATGVTMRLPVHLQVPIGAFFQGNRHLVPWLFDRIRDLAGTEPAPTWDLHAGVGFLAAAAWSASERDLHVVEVLRQAARAARVNLPRARVAIGRRAETYLARARDLPKKALVLTDPPRTGLSKELRRRLADWRPRRVIMLGCDPATWARDTAYLLGHGYELTHLELVDLFPSTHHVEVLAAMETR